TGDAAATAATTGAVGTLAMGFAPSWPDAGKTSAVTLLGPIGQEPGQGPGAEVEFVPSSPVEPVHVDRFVYEPLPEPREWPVIPDNPVDDPEPDNAAGLQARTLGPQQLAEEA